MSCFGACAVERDWMMGQRVVGGGAVGGYFDFCVVCVFFVER